LISSPKFLSKKSRAAHTSKGKWMYLKRYFSLLTLALLASNNIQASNDIDWWINISPLGLGKSASQTGTVNRSGIGMRSDGITYSIRNGYYENTTLLDSLNKVSDCITEIECGGSDLITVNEWSFLVGKSFLNKALTFSTGLGYSEIEYEFATQNNSHELSLPLEASWSPSRNGYASLNISLVSNISEERSFYGLTIGLDFGSL